jgi:hypothetical protein
LFNKVEFQVTTPSGRHVRVSISLWWVALALLVAVVLAWR